MAKADIDFEKELWDAANELIGAVSENNYCKRLMSRLEKPYIENR